MDSPELDRKDVRRPMNAFLIFCKRHRTIVREKNPNLDNRSVTRILGDLWANLGDEEKTQYTDLAKQYKDAFMKANPDYKWHNPDKLLAPLCINKSTPRSSTIKNKEENSSLSESCISPGKLADPSNMGGLSLLLMADQQSSSNKQRSNLFVSSSSPSYTEDTKFMSSTTSLSAFAEMCSAQKIGSKDEDKDTCKDTESNSQEEFCLQSFDTVDDDEEVDEDEDCEDDGGLVLETEKEATVDEKGDNLADDKEEDENAIVACGKVVMDHIIDRLYSSSKTGRVDNIRKRMPSGNRTQIKDPLSTTHHHDNVNENKQILENLTKSRDELERKLLNDQSLKCRDTVPKQMDTLNPDEILMKSENNDSKTCPVSDLKFTADVNLKKKARKKKRYYSEGNEVSESSDRFTLDNSDNVRTDESNAKRKKLNKEESVDMGDLQEVDYQEADLIDDEFQPIRKSKRRNRGQRYQELIDEGIIQPSKERLAARRVDTVIIEETVILPSITDDDNKKKAEELGSEVLSMYPRQIRKRTRSESEKSKVTDDSSRYKTGDFDLEAQIAILPACSLEKVAKPKRTFTRPRTISESSRSSVSSDHGQESKAEIILTIPPHLKCKESYIGSEPVVGSRKRKARKHSVTRLTPVNAGLSTNDCPKEMEIKSENSIVEEKSKDVCEIRTSTSPTVTCDDSAITSHKIQEMQRLKEGHEICHNEVSPGLKDASETGKEECHPELSQGLNDNNSIGNKECGTESSLGDDDTKKRISYTEICQRLAVVSNTDNTLEPDGKDTISSAEELESTDVDGRLHAQSKSADSELDSIPQKQDTISALPNSKCLEDVKCENGEDEEYKMESCDKVITSGENDLKTVSILKTVDKTFTQCCDTKLSLQGLGDSCLTQGDLNVKCQIMTAGSGDFTSRLKQTSDSNIKTFVEQQAEPVDTKDQNTDTVVSMTANQLSCAYDAPKPVTADSQSDSTSAFITMDIGSLRNNTQDAISSNLDTSLQGVQSPLQNSSLKVGLYVNS